MKAASEYQYGDRVTRTDDDASGSLKQFDPGVVSEVVGGSVLVFWYTRGCSKLMDPSEIAPAQGRAVEKGWADRGDWFPTD